ncbi:MAG: hypothetical protein ACXU9U_01105 [Parachlamydiaceae bacterium]
MKVKKEQNVFDSENGRENVICGSQLNSANPRHSAIIPQLKQENALLIDKMSWIFQALTSC